MRDVGEDLMPVDPAGVPDGWWWREDLAPTEADMERLASGEVASVPLERWEPVRMWGPAPPADPDPTASELGDAIAELGSMVAELYDALAELGSMAGGGE